MLPKAVTVPDDAEPGLAPERFRFCESTGTLPGERRMNRQARAAVAIIGTPQRDQTSATIPDLPARCTPLLRIDATVPHRHRAGQSGQLNL
jgi:hypothetical protein